MAAAEELGVDQANERDVARELEFTRLQERRQQQQLAQRARRQSAPAVPGIASITGQASAVATTAYRQVWERTQIAVEGLNLAFFGAGAIVAGIPTVGLYLIRLVFGNLFGGFGSFTFQGVSVPRVPGYTWMTGLYHTGVTLLLVTITMAILLGILFAYYLITNPAAAVQFGFCKFFGWILNFFGNTSCTVVP